MDRFSKALSAVRTAERWRWAFASTAKLDLILGLIVAALLMAFANPQLAVASIFGSTVSAILFGLTAYLLSRLRPVLREIEDAVKADALAADLRAMQLQALALQEMRLEETVARLKESFDRETQRLEKIRAEREEEARGLAYEKGLRDRPALDAYLADSRHRLRLVQGDVSVDRAEEAG